MRVILAGYNLDCELIDGMREAGVDPEQLTPETLSAAYARISRNPAPVNELRRQARKEVARARASNERIVFDMGHASVAEHAVFNFDLLALSRLAIEAVEHSRLCSYTEKSQRYIRLRDDHVVPREILDMGLGDRFEQLVDLQNRTYHLLFEKLREHIFASHPDLAADKGQRRTLEGWAKEDARYVTALATEGQLGMTANARSLEGMICRLAAHPLHEVRELAAALYAQATAVAPSLIRYTEPREEVREAAAATQKLVGRLIDLEPEPTLPGAAGAVHLVQVTPDSDTWVIASLLHDASRSPWTTCLARAKSLAQHDRAGVIHTALRALRAHDAVPRAFELVGCQFDIVLSAACFGQLKRHRMATLIAQPYDPALGYTVPEAVERVGMVPQFKQVMEQSTRIYEQVAEHDPEAAAYALTQAHRRRILLGMNARELYHFSRLRQDAHAQWDIRQLADRMIHLSQREMPLTLSLVCGKDRFDRTRAEVYGDDRG